KLPIYEPGLDDVVKRCTHQGLLHFSTQLEEAMQSTPILFIAVGTPPGEDGSADLSHVLAVAQEIGKYLTEYAVIVDKSTVPVGTAERVRQTIQKALNDRSISLPFDVVSNPEFLKEGAAVDDFMRPDRVIIGTDSSRAQALMEELYEPFGRTRDKVMVMGIRDAEMTKYAANAMLATKISFMNEMATLCERLGVDVENVRQGIGSDSRIGYSFIYPGCGYGGSCFPKDVSALVHMAEQSDFTPWVLAAVERRNRAQKKHLFDRITQHYKGNLTNRCFAIWGLAFKPGTDDMREASSLVIIDLLLAAGACVKVYDPIASATARKAMPEIWVQEGKVTFCAHQYEAVPEADALILVTEWKFFRQPDFDFLQRTLKEPVIFDGRNQYDPARLRERGFTYYGIGR
ncbi:MAG: UDP-glucose/GDP-mannose dehydrogenase family protein, partial [Gammaproteobacteria bacterium]